MIGKEGHERIIQAIHEVKMQIHRMVLDEKARLSCLLSGGHSFKWARNIHGDQIIFLSNGNRSEWLCQKCGAGIFRADLHSDQGDESPLLCRSRSSALLGRQKVGEPVDGEEGDDVTNASGQ